MDMRKNTLHVTTAPGLENITLTYNSLEELKTLLAPYGIVLGEKEEKRIVYGLTLAGYCGVIGRPEEVSTDRTPHPWEEAMAEAWM